MDFAEYILSLPHFIIIIYFFVTGSIFGSFANVLIHRTLRMIQEEEEREKKSLLSAKAEIQHVRVRPPASAGDKSVPGTPLQERNGDSLKEKPPLSLSEDSPSRLPLNEQTTGLNAEKSAEAPGSFQEFYPISLKERFTDRIMQHVEFFYCLFVFCVKKPVQFVWRGMLFSIKFFQKKKKREKEPSSVDPLKAAAPDSCAKDSEASLNPEEKAEKEQNKSGGSYSAEKKEESFPLDLMGHSRCPHCSYKIPFYLNIPILSWFFLKGRCRNCQARLTFRYPLVEFLMACLFTGLFVLIGWKWFLLESLIFVFGLTVVSFIDWDRMILPSFFTLPGIYLGLAGGFLNPERAFSSALIGWFAGGFILWLSGYLYFKIRRQEGMGDGDVSLMGWIGAVLGWKSISFVLIISCFFGVIFGIWGILRNRKDAQTPFPFGPCLAAGAVCYLFTLFLNPDILRVFSPF